MGVNAGGCSDLRSGLSHRCNEAFSASWRRTRHRDLRLLCPIGRALEMDDMAISDEFQVLLRSMVSSQPQLRRQTHKKTQRSLFIVADRSASKYQI